MMRHALVRSAWPWVLLVLVSFLAHQPAIHGGLIMDDAEHITPAALQGWSGLRRIWFEVGATPHYYPVLNSAFWLEHRLWGSALVGYHVANIVQHALAAGLVMVLARRLGLAGALFAGLVFALHPVHVESVAWISEQKNTLSTLLALAAVVLYLRFHDTRRRRHHLAASALFLLALLTKTVVAVVPPALLVIAWWRQGRLDLRREVLPLVPWLIIGAALGLFSAWFEQVHSHARGEAFHASALERALLAGRAVIFYLRTLAWPNALMFINPRWTLDAGNPLAWAPAMIVVAAGCGCLVLARRWRGPLAVYLLYLGMLFPVLGFLNINWFNFSRVANHFQYLPSIALIMPFAAALTAALRAHGRPVVRFGVPALSAVALTAMTRMHADDYRSAEQLYRVTLTRNPECWLAHNNLGTLLLADADRLPEATVHFQRAVALKPDHARAHNNLAAAMLAANRMTEALAHYRRSLELQDGVPEVHFNFAQALVKAGRESEALAEFARALALRPEYAEAQLGRADLLAGMPDRRSEAVAAYRAALRTNPALVEAYNNLGSLLGSEAGTRTEAIACLTEAVRLAPDYADARFNLGVLLAAQEGREAEAAAHWREFVRLRPEEVEGRWYLANLLRRDPKGRDEAVVHLKAIVRLAPDNRDARSLLARLAAP